MSTRWIANAIGRQGLIDEADFNTWSQVYGWHAAPDPTDTTQIYVKHVAENLHGSVPFGALAAGWADAGWEPGPPPTPADPTRPKQPDPQAPPPEDAAVEAPEAVKTVTRETKTRG